MISSRARKSISEPWCFMLQEDFFSSITGVTRSLNALSFDQTVDIPVSLLCFFALH